MTATPDSRTLDDLRTISRQIWPLRDKLTPLEDARRTLIREARAAGWSLQAIADACEVTRERIFQITRRPIDGQEAPTP